MTSPESSVPRSKLHIDGTGFTRTIRAPASVALTDLWMQAGRCAYIWSFDDAKLRVLIGFADCTQVVYGTQRPPKSHQYWASSSRPRRRWCKACLRIGCWLSLPRAAPRAYLPQAAGLWQCWGSQVLPDGCLEDTDTMHMFVEYINAHLHLSAALHASYHTANKK